MSRCFCLRVSHHGHIMPRAFDSLEAKVTGTLHACLYNALQRPLQQWIEQGSSKGFTTLGQILSTALASCPHHASFENCQGSGSWLSSVVGIGAPDHKYHQTEVPVIGRSWRLFCSGRCCRGLVMCHTSMPEAAMKNILAPGIECCWHDMAKVQSLSSRDATKMAP